MLCASSAPYIGKNAFTGGSCTGIGQKITNCRLLEGRGPTGKTEYAEPQQRLCKSHLPQLGVLRPKSSVLTYCISAGRPVSRSIRLAIGGWVENRLPKLIPRKGATMNKCAVEGEAAIGRRFE